MNQLISIVVPSFNKDRYIKETIDSVIKQTYVDWELIIVDDVSNDGTLDIIREFQKADSRIKLFVNVENKGANYSRNFGINEAHGKYIIFLDADDLLKFDCLEQRLKVIENSNYDFCVFTMGVFTHKIGDSSYQWIPNSKEPLEDFLQHKLPWSILQPIWKKEFLTAIEGFDTKFERLQDVELHTRALLFKDVKYKQLVVESDCFYRIDEKRKNFKAFDFYNRWVNSAIMYYSKFYPQCQLLNIDHFLMGTIHSTYLQVLYTYKKKEITDYELEVFENKLFNNELKCTLNSLKKFLLKFTKTYNLMPFRIPGINWLIKQCLVNF